MYSREGCAYIGKQKIIFIVDDAGCWLCQCRQVDKDGYAQIEYRGTKTRVHRATYQDRNNIMLPLDIHVRHTCDNPLCIRPDHLLPGTAAENARDKINHGRQLYGEQIKSCKLTDEQVKKILLSKDKNVKKLSKQYGVNESHIRNILNGKCRVNIYKLVMAQSEHKPKLQRMPDKPAINGEERRKRRKEILT